MKKIISKNGWAQQKILQSVPKKRSKMRANKFREDDQLQWIRWLTVQRRRIIPTSASMEKQKMQAKWYNIDTRVWPPKSLCRQGDNYLQNWRSQVMEDHNGDYCKRGSLRQLAKEVSIKKLPLKNKYLLSLSSVRNVKSCRSDKHVWSHDAVFRR